MDIQIWDTWLIATIKLNYYGEKWILCRQADGYL